MKSQATGLKRGLPTSIEEGSELGKKARHHKPDSDDEPHTPLKKTALPSPLTNLDSITGSALKDGTVTPPSPVQTRQLLSPAVNEPMPSQTYSDSQTQPFSQLSPFPSHNYQVDDEEKEGVWGYLVPIDTKSSRYGALVLKDRQACTSDPGDRVREKSSITKEEVKDQEEDIEKSKREGKPSKGYLVGRHPECDLRIDSPTVSNRHCLLFSESRAGNFYAILEDTSGNGTFVNDALVGRNHRRELRDGDEISILEEARFYFRYPRHRISNGFKQQYMILDQLGKGHFATVYLCVDKTTGMRWAVKKFERTGEKNRIDGLQQEIAVLMSISHPSLLCLKGAYEEDDGVYVILELAAEGELFNWIVMKQKLAEAETRKIFVQLFQAIKYLHERNIVHRDIKPENILLADKDLTVKLADFGLAKIIGEESFTTTLCGTPSYVAPEILQPSARRRYTKAVDIWSLGVVLYICLCGFPPFSDELYTPENPYTLAQQILAGRYDFPSPYWDSVGDPALDLIDRMLSVNPKERISIDECLEHPWITGNDMGPAGESVLSTDGLLAGRMDQLDFSKRKPVRERTLLSALNEIHVAKVIEDPSRDSNKNPPVVVYAKNATDKASQNGYPTLATGPAEKALDAKAGASGTRFLAVGNNGDTSLFAEDETSKYPEGEAFRHTDDAKQ